VLRNSCCWLWRSLLLLLLLLLPLMCRCCAAWQ
jgi:hypothetical protein